MKKIIALALAMVMAFSMVACGGSTEEESNLIATNPEFVEAKPNHFVACHRWTEIADGTLKYNVD